MCERDGGFLLQFACADREEAINFVCRFARTLPGITIIMEFKVDITKGDSL